MSWGKGGMVGVRKAIWEHERAQIIAMAILEKECGEKHETGSHSLCPTCEEHRRTQSAGRAHNEEVP